MVNECRLYKIERWNLWHGIRYKKLDLMADDTKKEMELMAGNTIYREGN